MQQGAVGAEVELTKLQARAFEGYRLYRCAQEMDTFFAVLARGKAELNRHVFFQQPWFRKDDKYPTGIEVAQACAANLLPVALNAGVDNLRFRRWLVQAAPPRDGRSLATEEVAGLLPVGRVLRFVRVRSKMLDTCLVGVKQ